MKIRIDGLSELQARLGELASRAQERGVLTRAGKAALQPMADVARSNAPRDTGALAGSIATGTRAESDARSIGKKAFARALRGGAGKAAAVQALRDAQRIAADGATVELFMGPSKGDRRATIKARVQELGSSKQTARPYLRPAFDAEAQGTIDRFGRLLAAEIDKAVARNARRAARKG